ncbi:MAG: serine hydrolase, partial [Ilumatobacteraceae bacterium]
MTTDRLRERIDAIVAAQVQPRGPRSCVLGLEVPSRGFEHTAAAGAARADSSRAASADDRFHVASVGKMFTAVLVTRAAAAGSFGRRGIDTSLGEFDVLSRHVLRALHPEGDEITIRQLLTHT